MYANNNKILRLYIIVSFVSSVSVLIGDFTTVCNMAGMFSLMRLKCSHLITLGLQHFKVLVKLFRAKASELATLSSLCCQMVTWPLQILTEDYFSYHNFPLEIS